MTTSGMEMIAADAIIALDKAAGQIEAVASEMGRSLDRSIFMVVAGDLREAESKLRTKLRIQLTARPYAP